MRLDDFRNRNAKLKLARLARDLKENFGLDLSSYYDLDELDLHSFINDLEHKKATIISESATSNYIENLEYVRATLLIEAINMILTEIAPKRLPRKKNAQNVKETMDYKVHTPTGAAVDHDIDQDYERPDLYWRRDQWEHERSQEDHPVTVKTYDITDSEDLVVGPDDDAYAQNRAEITGDTPENHQEVGAYVAIMNPDRFLDIEGEDEPAIVRIVPNVKSGNDESIFTGQVSPKFIDVNELSSDLYRKLAMKEDTLKKLESLKGLKEQIESKMMLTEGELERAELVLAMRDIVSRLQKMIEDVGKMLTEDVMPLVDGLRTQFGEDYSDQFNNMAERHIQEAADTLQAMKDTFDQESNKLEQRISDGTAAAPMNDMGDAENPVSSDLNLANDGDDLGDEMTEPGEPADDEINDALGGEPEAASDEPLGRAKKEGVVVSIKGNKVKLSESQLKSIVFAKNFYRLMENKNARAAKLSNSQGRMLQVAKNIFEAIDRLNKKKK